MPLPNLPVPDFPNVPPLPGVPALPRAPGESLGSFAISTVLSDAVDFLQSILRPQWGIFDSRGVPVAPADTALSIEYRGDSHISGYPQEEGGFASYNKVQVPYQARVQLVCAKSEAARQEFLAQIEAAKQSTMLFRVVTPDVTYENANVIAYDYRRTSRAGVTLLVVEVFVEEVRQTVVAKFAYQDNTPSSTVTGAVRINTFSNVASPASADPVSLGQVQTVTPTAGQAALFGPVGVSGTFGGVL
ncbi:hypothetical protein [Burkholderia glumae]|uniref:Uncharacterized protein n=1 Tax=Burkholderia glumae TaxID=337 RepID=A0AAP9Y2D5_BURGL|nr:hypothetical protein [Burkholderia glumae]AJY65693.1 hypothetical protein KS03_899 [Burkholderia glumae LMG 2196 = ATCC 33617]PNL00128.1 hypothetical protein CEQ24_013255 [Burkholderia glumae]QJP73103.1 hypothetical protein HJC54_23915 [Burkholderia glumae]QPQ92027.1 hypothetical protein I6H06_23290 [Burkholderia glumae]QQM89761.1 hypothetical protein I6G78_11345 [Burkholderia glumae]